MLKEGSDRLRSMLENVEVRLAQPKEGWLVRVTRLALCEGEIIFFDRTVNGVRKPTTVVDVQLKLEWEASTSTSSEAAHSTLGGVSTCSELSMEALSEGITMETNVTDDSATYTAEVRCAVTARLSKLLDAVGRAFFQDLHEALHIPPPAIAPPNERPKPKQARPKPKASVAAAPSSSRSSSATANLKLSDRKNVQPTKHSRVPKKQKKKVGAPKTSTAFVVCIAAGIVVGVGLLAWRYATSPGPSSSNGNSSNLLRPAAGRAQSRGNASGSPQTTRGSAGDATGSLLNLLKPQIGPIRDLRDVR
jgi:cell division septation protein DedD